MNWYKVLSGNIFLTLFAVVQRHIIIFVDIILLEINCLYFIIAHTLIYYMCINVHVITANTSIIGRNNIIYLYVYILCILLCEVTIASDKTRDLYTYTRATPAGISICIYIIYYNSHVYNMYLIADMYTRGLNNVSDLTASQRINHNLERKKK